MDSSTSSQSHDHLAHVTNVRKGACYGSDHNMVTISMRLPRPTWKSGQSRPAAAPKRPDRRQLLVPEIKAEFIDSFKMWMAVTTTIVTLGAVATMAAVAAAETLTEGKRRSSAPWFTTEVDAAVSDRERWQRLYNMGMSSARRPLARARLRVKCEVNRARAEWHIHLCEDMRANRGMIWDGVSTLTKGWGLRLKKSRPMMKDSTGKTATTPLENATIWQTHLDELFTTPVLCDPSVIDELQQHDIDHALAALPTRKEVSRVIQAMKSDKATGPDDIAAEYLQALNEDPEAASLLYDAVTRFWTTREMPSKLTEAILVVIFKNKGSASDPTKYRTLCLQSQVAKIVEALITERLLKRYEALGNETQFGFRPGRSAADLKQVLRTLLNHRREEDLATVMLVCDLKKAFDRVDRDLLFNAMLKYGVPLHVVLMMIALYCDSEITLELPDGTKIVVRPTIGVKQGAVPSPVCFIFLMMAFTDTMPWPEDVPAITFKWAWDGDLRQHHRSKDQHQHDAMASGTAQLRHLDYADDLTLLFAGVADLAKTFPILYRHGRRWSLELHLTRGEEVSKTFAVYVPSTSNPKSEADRSPIPVPAVEVAGTFTEPGSVTFESKAEILGTIFTDDLLDETDVKRRIKKAARVFGALRKTVFATRHQSLAVKREVYEAAVIGTLWHGSEDWRLRQSDLARSQAFH